MEMLCSLTKDMCTIFYSIKHDFSSKIITNLCGELWNSVLLKLCKVQNTKQFGKSYLNRPHLALVFFM